MITNFAIPRVLGDEVFFNEINFIDLKKFKNKLLVSTQSNLSWLKSKSTSTLSEFDCVLVVTSHESFRSLMLKFKDLNNFYFDVIVAVGGGSAIDFAKIIRSFVSTQSAQYNYESNTLEFLEFIKKNQDSSLFPRLISIPTTTGTGSEVTSFSTIWDYEQKIKFSFDSNYYGSDEIVFIPSITKTLPESLRIATMLDALSHAFESLWSRNSNPVSELFANKAISIILNLLQKEIILWNDKDFLDIQYASYYGGVAINITRTGVCHSLSYPLTLHYGVLHGLACSFSIPFVLRKLKRQKIEINIHREILQNIGNFKTIDTFIEDIFEKHSVFEKISTNINDNGIKGILLSGYNTNERSKNSVIEFSDQDILQLIDKIV